MTPQESVQFLPPPHRQTERHAEEDADSKTGQKTHGAGQHRFNELTAIPRTCRRALAVVAGDAGPV